MPGLAQRGDAPAVGRDDAGVPGGAAQGGVVGVGVGAPHRALAHRLGSAPAGEGHGQIGVDRQALRARPGGAAAVGRRQQRRARGRDRRRLGRGCRRLVAGGLGGTALNGRWRGHRLRCAAVAQRQPAAKSGDGQQQCDKGGHDALGSDRWERPLRRWRGRRGRAGRRCRVRGAEADDDFGQAAPMGLARRAPGVDPLLRRNEQLERPRRCHFLEPHRQHRLAPCWRRARPRASRKPSRWPPARAAARTPRRPRCRRRSPRRSRAPARHRAARSSRIRRGARAPADLAGQCGIFRSMADEGGVDQGGILRLRRRRIAATCRLIIGDRKGPGLHFSQRHGGFSEPSLRAAARRGRQSAALCASRRSGSEPLR